MCAGGGITASVQRLCSYRSERQYSIHSPPCRHGCAPAQRSRDPWPGPAVMGIDDLGGGLLGVLPGPLDVFRSVTAQVFPKPLRRRRNTVSSYRSHDGGPGHAAAPANQRTYHASWNARLCFVAGLVALSLFVRSNSLAVRAAVRA